MAEEKTETKASSDTKAGKDDKTIPEWLTPVLSGLGSMGGSYMLWIKPLQDKMDALVKQFNELESELDDLRENNRELAQQSKELEKELNGLQENQACQSNSRNDYLPIKKPNCQVSLFKKRI